MNNFLFVILYLSEENLPKAIPMLLFFNSVRSWSVCFCIIMANYCHAQFEQKTHAPIQEDSLAVKERYHSIAFANQSWYVLGEDIGLIAKASGQGQWDFPFSYPEPHPFDAYSFTSLCGGDGFPLVLSNEKGGAAAHAVDGRQFTTIETALSSKVVSNKDTLFALQRSGGVSASAAYLLWSVDEGISWDTNAVVPYDYNNSYLIQSQGGAPIYVYIQGTQISLYELFAYGASQVSTPGSIGVPFVAGNDSLIGAGFYNSATLRFEPYWYHRQNKSWTKVPASFGLKQFSPQQFYVSQQGLWTIYGLMDSLGVEAPAVVQYDMQNWGQLNLPSSGDVYQVLCESGECFSRGEEGLFFSPDNGQNWEKLNWYNTPVLDQTLMDSRLLFATAKGIYQIESDVVSDRFIFNDVLKVKDVQLLSDAGIVYALITREDGKNLLYASFDGGLNWESEPLPTGDEFSLEYMQGNEVYGYSEFHNRYFWKNGQNQAWQELTAWGNVRMYKLIGSGNGFLAIKQGFEVYHSADRNSGFFDRIHPFTSGFSSKAYDLKWIQGELYLLMSLDSGAGIESKVYQWNDLDWQEVLRFPSNCTGILDVGNGTGLFYRTRWGRQPDVYKVDGNQLELIYDALPDASLVSSLVQSNEGIWLASQNFGLWQLSPSQLGLQALQPSSSPEIKIFPNPLGAGEELQIQWSRNQPWLRLNVYNAVGQLVSSQEVYKAQGLSFSLSPGVYTCEFIGLDEVLSQPLVLVP